MDRVTLSDRVRAAGGQLKVAVEAGVSLNTVSAMCRGASAPRAGVRVMAALEKLEARIAKKRERTAA
jgi:hypothetical protein